MKKFICILIFLIPIVAFAQQPRYKYSPTDYMWKYVGNEGFSTGGTEQTTIAISPSGQVYVAFADEGNSLKATVMEFDGTSWADVGNADFTEKWISTLSLAISASGEPYVAFSDWANSQKATVMKFNDTSWVNVGSAGFSSGEADYISLAFSPSGEPYISYEDNGYSDSIWRNKASVMKFDGTNWVYIGNEGFSAGEVYNTSLAFSPIDSLPYVAYMDIAEYKLATVMKFDGTNWVYVGSEGFSAGMAQSPSLAFNTSGEPYVGYMDEATDKATVMKFDGTNWVYVGSEGFSAGMAHFTSLAFSPSDGGPYVAYEDMANSYKATVMRFNGNNWVNVGNAGFSADTVAFTSLAFNPSGQPYVAYSDGANSQKATVMKYDSVMVGINELQESMLSIYPNPSTDKITIELSGSVKESYLAIVNTEGQQLLTRQITDPKTQIDISNLPNGVYFVRLTNDKSVEVRKFVKQ